MKARQAPLLLLTLACFGLAACADRAENTDPASVKPQPALSAPAEAESTDTTDTTGAAAKDTAAADDTAAPLSDGAVTPNPEEVEAQEEPMQETEEVAPPAAATPEAKPSEKPNAKPAPTPVAAEEVVPTEAEVSPTPATPAPTPPPAHDPAAATRSDPVPDELHGGGAVVEAEPDDIYFPNCAAAEAGGYSAMKQGEAGYRTELDDNGNGVACE